MKHFYKTFVIIFCTISIGLIFGKNLDHIALPTFQVLHLDPEPPVLTASVTHLCTPGKITLMASGEGQFRWYNKETGEEIPSSGSASLEIEVEKSTTFYVQTEVPGQSPVQSNELTIRVHPPIRADFEILQTESCASTAVSFQNTSVGSSLEYHWDFGDPASGAKNSSTQKNPTHEFVGTTGSGTQSFEVTLTVTNPSSGCNHTYSDQVVVSQLPSTNMGGTGLSEFEGQPIFRHCSNEASLFTFTNTSTTTSSNTSYTIDWGDGSEVFRGDSWSSLTHTYEVGFWTITYTVEGANGCSNTREYTVFVGNNPAVSLGNPGNTEICISQELTFPITGTENNPIGTTYTVSFNDGSDPITFQHPPPPTVSHTFKGTSCGVQSSDGRVTYPNSFSANIVASNPCGESSVGVVPIRVSTPPSADFSTPENPVCVDQTINLTNLTTGAAQIDAGTCDQDPNIVWTIDGPGDTRLHSGELGNDFGILDQPSLWIGGSENLSVSFPVPGIYTIGLLVGNRCGQDYIEKTICVVTAPEPDFELTQQEVCLSPALATVAASNTTEMATSCDSEPLSYLWEVDYTPPTVDPALEASWRFINGTGENDVNAEFEFSAAGTYNILLTASNSCGTTTTSKTVEVTQAPKISLEPIENLCAADEVVVEPELNVINYGESALTYLWKFPGGTPATSTDVQPKVTYTESGTFSYSVEVTGECGTTLKEASFTINPPLVADAGEDVTICPGSTTSLEATAQGGTGRGYSYSWFPEEGLDDPSSPTPMASPDKTTTYTLTVFDGQCSNTAEVTVLVNTFHPGEITGAQTLCYGEVPQPLTETLPAESEGLLSYQWQVSHDNQNFVDIEGATATSYSPEAITQSSYYRRVAISELNGISCRMEGKAVWVQVNSVSPGIFNQNQTICEGGDPGMLTPTSPATGKGPLTYLWESSVDNIHFTQVSTSENFDPPSLEQTTYFRRTVTSTIDGSTCSATEGVITIEVIPGPEISSQPLTKQSLCEGTTPQALEVEVSPEDQLYFYQWFQSPSANISEGTPIAGATGPSYTPSTDTEGTSFYFVEITTGVTGCRVVSQWAEVEVVPIPQITQQPQSSQVCIGGSPELLEVSYKGGIGLPSYQWYSQIQGESPRAIPGAKQASYQPKASEPGSISYFVQLSFDSGSCSEVKSEPAVVQVDPIPSITTPVNHEICSGTRFTVNPENGSENNIPPGTTYTWDAPKGSGFTGGSAQPVPQPEISQSLINTTNEPVVALYTVTPLFNDCVGEPFTVSVLINPRPVIENKKVEICHSGTFSYDPENDANGMIVPLGTTYSWEAPVVTGGLEGGSSGSGDKIEGFLINRTNQPQTATYQVTPNWNGCPGDPFEIEVLVHPTPDIQDKELGVCSNASFSISPENDAGDIVPISTTYSWEMPEVIPEGAVSGASPGSAQGNISQVLRNTTTEPATVIYTVTPETETCSGDAFEIRIQVLPEPVVDPVQDLSLCTGSRAEILELTSLVPGTQFTWINNRPDIGLPASGTGNIPSFEAINRGADPVTATITMTPQLEGCTGEPKSFEITVHPSPTIAFSLPNQTICSSEGNKAVTLQSETPNTIISWSALVPEGITGALKSGTDHIPSQPLVNATTQPLTIIYTASAQTVGVSCPGPEFQYHITVNPVPRVVDDLAETFCSGQSFSVSPPDDGENFVPSGTTYTWSKPSGSGFSGGSAELAGQERITQTLVNETNAPVTAVYQVTPEFEGCKGDPFTLKVTINPTAEIEDSKLEICTGGTFNMNPAEYAVRLPEGTTFFWDPPVVTGGMSGGTAGIGESIISGSLTNNTSSPQKATYHIRPVSPSGSCEGEAFKVEVIVYPEMAIQSSVSNFNGFQISGAGIEDGFIDLMPSGGSGIYSYQWEGPEGFSASTQSISGLRAGTYQVTITDGYCQEQVLVFDLQEPNPLKIIEIEESRGPVECFGATTGVLEVAISEESVAPFTYRLLDHNGRLVQSREGAHALNHRFDHLAANTYTIEVEDANGTIKTISSLIIDQPDQPLSISQAEVTNFNGFSISCYGAGNGAIDISVAGGTPGYSYSWSGPGGFEADTEDISGLKPGTYHVLITDATGTCQLEANYLITEPDPLAVSGVISNYNGYGVSCHGGTDGSIQPNPTGGTGDYTFKWSGPNGFRSEQQNLERLEAGTYTLELMDSNGCVLETATYELTQPDPLVLSEVHQDVLCYGAATGSIDVSVSGGVITGGSGNYQYLWSGPDGYTATSEDIENLPAGEYHLKVTDVSGCSAELSVTITQEPEIEIIASTTPVSCYQRKDASISLEVSGGNGPYQINWDNLATGAFQDNLGAGDYRITVTDALNCQKEIVVNIPEAPVFKIDPVVEQVSCYGAADGSIALNLTGGKEPISLTWSDGSTAGTTRNNLQPGIYTAIIEDGTSCYIEETFVIVQPDPLTLGGSVTHATACDNPQSGSIDLQPSGGVPPYSYHWSNGQITKDLENITQGRYSVEVKDANGCSATAEFQVSRQQPLSINVVPELLIDCQTNSVKQVNMASASGGIAPYTFTWSSGAVSGNENQLMETSTNGSVMVTVQDHMGCTAQYLLDVDIEKLGDASFTAESYSEGVYGTYSIQDPIRFTNTSSGDWKSVVWDFGDGTVSTDEHPEHTYVNQGTFTITQTVNYPYDCQEIYIYKVEIDKGYKLMIPNAFTPNDDGMNDYFKPEYRGLEEIELYVYDTWGTMLYHEKGPVISGWNGATNQQPSENGNYYYIVKATTFYGKSITREGPFALLR